MPKKPRASALTEARAARDPFRQFARWYDAARKAEMPLPNAAVLATATRAGRPSLRTVLLKDFDTGGFVFFTNYRSRKARELEHNARASLLFYWGRSARQVRIEGRVEKLPARDSDEYFSTRPRGSQIGAWASPQSAVLAGRADLDRRFAAAARRYPREVPRPPHWGGYRLAPDVIEFWQGREDRLHDRLRYRRRRRGWRIDRLAP